MKNALILHGADNDPYDCGIRHGKEIQKHVGGELILKKGEGHFNLEVGTQYKEFPLLLSIIDSESSSE